MQLPVQILYLCVMLISNIHGTCSWSCLGRAPCEMQWPKLPGVHWANCLRPSWHLKHGRPRKPKNIESIPDSRAKGAPSRTSFQTFVLICFVGFGSLPKTFSKRWGSLRLASICNRGTTQPDSSNLEQRRYSNLPGRPPEIRFDRSFGFVNSDVFQSLSANA